MNDTKSPADAIAPALRNEAELRELARLYAKWYLKDFSRFFDVCFAAKADAETRRYE